MTDITRRQAILAAIASAAAVVLGKIEKPPKKARYGRPLRRTQELLDDCILDPWAYTNPEPWIPTQFSVTLFDQEEIEELRRGMFRCPETGDLLTMSCFEEEEEAAGVMMDTVRDGKTHIEDLAEALDND